MQTTGNQIHHVYVSARLRAKARQLIAELGRPVAAQELVQFLQVSDPELWTAVSRKCGDYTRMILGQPRNSHFVKYKRYHPMPGIDRRAVYYGLPEVADYGEDWVRVSNPVSDSRKVSNARTETATAIGAATEPAPATPAPSIDVSGDSGLWTDLLAEMETDTESDIDGDNGSDGLPRHWIDRNSP